MTEKPTRSLRRETASAVGGVPGYCPRAEYMHGSGNPPSTAKGGHRMGHQSRSGPHAHDTPKIYRTPKGVRHPAVTRI